MIRNAILVVIVVGITAFIVRNIFFNNIKQIPQQKGIVTREAQSADREIFRGQFKGMDGIHNVVGDAVVVETQNGPLIRFEKFSASPGPDLVVYLTSTDNVTFNKDLGSQYVSLGPLQKMNGEQSYTIPKKYIDYKSVVIWSRALNILWGAAPIK